MIAVFKKLGDLAPVRQWLVEDIDQRNIADIGIGARPVAELLRVGAEADIDGQDPEALENLEKPRFGGQRQGNDQQIGAHAAHEIDELIGIAELAKTGDGGRRAIVVAIVEYADDGDVAVARMRGWPRSGPRRACRRRRERRGGRDVHRDSSA